EGLGLFPHDQQDTDQLVLEENGHSEAGSETDTRPGICVFGALVDIGNVHDLPRHGRAARPRRPVERVTMLFVPHQLVDTADTCDREKDLSLRDVEHGVLAGAEPHGGRRHLVEHRLDLSGTYDCTEDAADRILLLAEAFVAPSELLDVDGVGQPITELLIRGFRAAHARTLRRSTSAPDSTSSTSPHGVSGKVP